MISKRRDDDVEEEEDDFERAQVASSWGEAAVILGVRKPFGPGDGFLSPVLIWVVEVGEQLISSAVTSMIASIAEI